MTAESSPAAVVDLSSFEESIRRQEEGILVDILGPDGRTPLGLQIKVAGPDSQRAIAAQEALSDEFMARREAEPKAAGRPTSREATERAIRYLARVTMDWSPGVKIDGQERAYSEESAVLLYTRFRLIYQQVDRASGDRARFAKV